MTTTASSAMDPLDHPDLRSLGERLGAELDDVLAAEQHAARIAASRRMSLRDRLVRAEDMCVDVAVTTSHGRYTGSLVAVGTDHIVVDGPGRTVIALRHIVALKTLS